MTTGWFPDPSINQPWDAPSWSISCEVLFYALLPVLVPLLRRMSMRRLVLIGVVAYVVQGLCVADLKAVRSVEGGYLLYQFPLVHLPEFLAGVVAALWFVRRPAPLGRAARRLLIGSAATGIAALALTQPVTPAYYCYTPLFVMLVLGLAARGARTDWLGSATAVLLGEASYSLYLLHVPLGRLFVLSRGPTPQWTGYLFTVAVIGVSVVSLRCYEAPLRRAAAGAARLRPAPSGLRQRPSLPICEICGRSVNRCCGSRPGSPSGRDRLCRRAGDRRHAERCRRHRLPAPAARCHDLLSGQSVYTDKTFVYPPAAAALLVPLAWGSTSVSFAWWIALSAAAPLVAAVLISRVTPLRPRLLVLGVSAIVLCGGTTVTYSLALGNLTLLLVPIAVWIVVSLDRGSGRPDWPRSPSPCCSSRCSPRWSWSRCCGGAGHRF